MPAFISRPAARNAAPGTSVRRSLPARHAHRIPFLDNLAFLLALLALLAICATSARAQVPPNTAGEFGDAPEGILAYSNVQGLPVTGRFPTVRAGAAGVAFHAAAAPTNNCFLGWTIDYEWDGAANGCASPYEQDEPSTLNDCDAGVVGPEPFTIVGGLETPMFDPLNPRALGVAGEVAHWGQGPDDNLDLWVTNTTNATAYLSMLVDWDQDGDWDGAPDGAPAGELQPASVAAPALTNGNITLRNFPVPALYSGWLSMLHPPLFVIGQRSGYVWGRFTISAGALNLVTWSGGGSYSRGESSDFLWWVKPGPPVTEGAELGDAPDGHLAYPAPWTLGNFPTCVSGLNGSVWHNAGSAMMFGTGLDFESDGNHDNCSFMPYDNDELYMDPNGDAGLMRPEPYTLTPVGTVVAVGPGTQSHDIGPACGLAAWGPDIDILVSNLSPNTAYVNVLFDWDRSGTWGGPSFNCGANTVTEWAVRNVPIGPGYTGGLQPFLGGQPLALGAEGFVWVRFTISESGLQRTDWDGQGSFLFGESEDYLLHVGPPSTSAVQPLEPGSPKLELLQNRPNPVSGSTVIPFQLDARGAARLDIFDIAGRKVRTLVDGELAAGAHAIDWNGCDDSGSALSDGIYLYRLNAGDRVESRRMVLVKSRR